MAMQRTAPVRDGFTLIELLVVVAIIAVLIAPLLPAVQSCREAARRVYCVNNLVQISVALLNYESTHETFPPGVVNLSGPVASRPAGYHQGWLTQILPFIEQANAYKRIDFRTGVYDPANATVRAHLISTLLCPSDLGNRLVAVRALGVAPSSYAACHHHRTRPIDANNTGVFYLNSHTRIEDIYDGTSNTILVGEKLLETGDLGWMSGTRATLRNTGLPPNANPAGTFGVIPPVDKDDGDPAAGPSPDPALWVGGYASRHPGGANFIFGDGSVKFIKSTITPAVFHRIGHRADGEVVSSDEF
jgi:prepilin-type N-terminal cleavage/methylation domain-containing protein/prepilin-type processing-associated H-X9-DG protein